MNIQIDSETGFLMSLLGFASIVGLLSGATLVLRPAWLAELGKQANRWIPTREVERSLERTINFDKWFYRHARIGSTVLPRQCLRAVYQDDRQTLLPEGPRRSNQTGHPREATSDGSLRLKIQTRRKDRPR